MQPSFCRAIAADYGAIAPDMAGIIATGCRRRTGEDQENLSGGQHGGMQGAMWGAPA